MLGLVLSNLLYPVIAVGVAALICVVVVLHHRRPKSVEANMQAFHKGLRALAPETSAVRAARPRTAPRPADPPRVVHRRPPASPGSSPGTAPGRPAADPGGALPVDEVEAETG